MSKRILIPLIFIFGIFAVLLGIATTDPFLSIVFFIVIFSIVNSGRYIKYRKWYVDPFIILPYSPNETISLLSAWIYFLTGIIIIIFIIDLLADILL